MWKYFDFFQNYYKSYIPGHCTVPGVMYCYRCTATCNVPQRTAAVRVRKVKCSVVGRLLTREVVKQNSSLILFQIFEFKMCHPNNFNKQIEVKKARKVVKKYRKMSYRKEMMRLRNLLSADENVSEGEILDKTVSLIEELESRLMSQLRQGKVPAKMVNAGLGLEWSQCSQESLRNIVGLMMASSQ